MVNQNTSNSKLKRIKIDESDQSEKNNNTNNNNNNISKRRSDKSQKQNNHAKKSTNRVHTNDNKLMTHIGTGWHSTLGNYVFSEHEWVKEQLFSLSPVQNALDETISQKSYGKNAEFQIHDNNEINKTIKPNKFEIKSKAPLIVNVRATNKSGLRLSKYLKNNIWIVVWMRRGLSSGDHRIVQLQTHRDQCATN